MTSLLIKPSGTAGHVTSVTPQSAGWRYVGFDCFRLSAGERIERRTEDREVCLVVLSGTADITANGETFQALGTRQSVFDNAAPDAVYVPSGGQFTVTARGDAEIAVCSAPGRGSHPVRHIHPESMTRETRGAGSNIRHVCNILPETEPADSLLVVEVRTPAGNWSSYPPHKHDMDDPPHETFLEETYYHRVNPSQGFAFQRVYTDDRSIDETMAVEDGDVVLVPRGYHPVGAAHGYDLYYLNVMAGPRRKWHFRNDPAHDWIVHRV